MKGSILHTPPAYLSEVQRKAKDGNLQAVTYPPIVLMYNKYIGWVNKKWSDEVVLTTLYL